MAKQQKKHIPLNKSINKKGPFSEGEKKYIADYHSMKSAKAIAVSLARDPKTVRAYIKKKYGHVYKPSEAAANELRNSPIWLEISNEFSEEELHMFNYHYSKIIEQFKDDVFHTEQLQIIDLVKIEILMNRLLSENKNTRVQIEALERQKEQLIISDKDGNRDMIMQIERQVGVMRGAMSNFTQEYNDFFRRKSEIMKDLKATREARVKHFEAGKNNYGTWMKQIIEDKTRREAVGLYIEKMRIATNVEYERLSDIHQYIDGQLDQPILTPESIGEKNEESVNNGD